MQLYIYNIINMQLNWWCYPLQATDIITNVHKQILAHNAAFMVYMVVMLLWLLMGSPAKVEDIVYDQIVQSG